MGYYSEYSLDLDLKDTAYKREDLIAELRNQNESAADALLPNGETADEHKWYSSDEDMLAFSKDYPDVVFALERYGLIFGDIQKYYFKNGEFIQTYGSIHIESFDQQPFEEVKAQLAEFSEKVETKLQVEIQLTSSPDFVAQECNLASLYQELVDTYADANSALDEKSESWYFYGHKWQTYEYDLLAFSEKHPKLSILVFPFIEDCDMGCRTDISWLQEHEIFDPAFNDIQYFDDREFHNGKMRRSKAKWVFDSVYGFVSSKTSN